MNSTEAIKFQKPNPLLKATFISKWFFWWTREIFKKGLSEELETEDLYAHLPSLDSKQLSSTLIRHWEKEAKRANPNILRLIFRVYGCRFIPLCIFYSILELTIHACQPLFLGSFVQYFAEGQTETTRDDAYLYAIGIVLCSLVSTLCFHPYMFYLFGFGTSVRVACAGLMYRKCLRASVAADNNGMAGFAISVLSTDLPQFDLAFYFVHDLWQGPVEAMVFGYLMYRQIGWPGIAGIVLIVIFIPLQAIAAKAAAHYRKRSAEAGDDRVKLMNEIITAIQVIKMYAWEKSFAKLVGTIRKKEIQAIRGSMIVYAALQCTNMISKLALFLSLISYALTGDIVTAQKVFIVSSYYDILNESLLNLWPLAINTWAETIVCARRVVAFLGQSETVDGGIDNFAAYEGEAKGHLHGRVHNPRALKKGLILHNVTASWEKQDKEKLRPHIERISFSVGEQQFFGIIGSVGAGKSTLLNAILGELDIVEGMLEVGGVISYGPQEAWIFEGTVRDNIIFAESYDEERYQAVLRACALLRDLQLMENGDRTIVGERGISLSGGQKARISMARAVYRQADIYIFDDPLSAVDSHVGKILMERCIKTFLKDKIRILVTHHVQHLQSADHIILLENGKAELQGTYDDLKNSCAFHVHTEQKSNEAEMKVERAVSSISGEVGSTEQHPDAESSAKDHADERKEQQLHGSVKLYTYAAYLAMLRQPWVVIAIFLLFLLARICHASMDIFISKWATWEESLPPAHETEESYRSERQRIITIYTAFIVCTLFLYIVRTYSFFHMCLRISLRLHDCLFNGIIRACMRFFHANPSGRILNRFSSDIGKTDVDLPKAMLDSLQFFINASAVLAVVAYANHWLLIPAILMIVLLYLCRRLYIGASRSLKRIESLTRSPVYSHTNQTFNGLTTIRALNATGRLESEFHAHQNNNTSALFLYVTTNRAFAFWTDLICVLYILLVTFSFLVMDKKFYSGDVGLAITQSMSLVIMCQWGMRQTAELENNMTSVERIMEYIHIPPEPPLLTDANIDLSNWPHSGRLYFRDFSLRYTESGDTVLKGLNLTIEPNEKIGIVGRTGAGKSSIIQAIFRLALNEGLIEIDGYDIENLGLHDLRSRISIIPQDPILFSGTLRYNLDPFGAKNDEELWNALEEVRLKTYIATLDGGLNCLMHEWGANFSHGQRQLVCMARAILHHNKILILDEATANVDPETDQLIQETLQRKFEDATVLTIAHRLHTVMDNDRVLVMDAGRVVQLGHPHDLLQDTEGPLYKFVQQTGTETAENLHLLAEQSHRKRHRASERL